MEPASPAQQLVVIGASAGGIEAIGAVLGTIQPNFPAPILVAQHLDPQRVSHLQEILAPRSRLPVRTVGAVETLSPGTVYLVPAGSHVVVTDHELRLAAGGPERPKPSIDRLLTSAAEIYRERLTAVIMTGTDGDGAAGAQAVHDHGGTVVIQDPLTARFPGMPLAVAPEIVDVVSPLNELGPTLDGLVRGMPADPASPPGQPTGVLNTPDEQMAEFLTRLREERGVDFTSYRLPTIRRRLQQRLTAVGVASLPDYERYLVTHPDEYQRLLNAFLIKVTSFFRDVELFDHLRDRVIPELIQVGRQRDNELRFWSAGCATGEEAYSLAILVAELLGSELERFTVRIFATDLDPGAISIARRGLYPASMLASTPPELVERYFVETDRGYEVTKPVRNLVIFGEHHLGQRPPFPRIDLVLCRNVLIYFTTELQKRVLQLFAYSLRDGGYLVLGKSETPSPLPGYFEPSDLPLRVYRRYGPPVTVPFLRRDPGASPWLAAPAGAPAPGSPAVGGPRRAARTNLDAGTAQAEREALRARLASERAEQLLLQLPIGIVLVDRRYDIQSINNLARKLLSIHGPAIGDDLIHLVDHLPATELRALIDLAFLGQAGADESAGSAGADHMVVATTNEVGEEHHIQLACYPYPSDPTATVPTVMITVTEVTPAVRERLQRELEYQVQARDNQLSIAQLTTALDEARAERVRRDAAAEAERTRLSTQVDEILATNRRLVAANEELFENNTQLRRANEESVLTQEEAQAAHEEVETLNEELQATNEELETLNEELHATVEELNTTNDDLRARSQELQQLAGSEAALRRVAETERSRLAATLASMADAVLVVDRAGRRVLANTAYEQLVERSRGELVAEDDGGRSLADEARPDRRAARGEDFRVEFTAVGANGTRRRYEASGRPVSSADEALGGVVVIRDITDR